MNGGYGVINGKMKYTKNVCPKTGTDASKQNEKPTLNKSFISQ
jgi:hypothetical protein